MRGVFDIVGPIMIGPSSSHTAGAARLGLMAGKILGEPVAKAEILLHGSFARTYRGHGTDKALIGGLLGFSPEDERIR
ncbi:MAG: L-serine ammonia-lyase, iron-sulfur-dependent, subunit beta, partial [Anaerovibrio sp.]|nr:L-serine ammonia-lyase, iron-sulfur-dependent, subunit beta [Anaerovibrio sp.]